MRRHDKQITDRRRMDEIIRGSLVCRVALAKANQPYLVPLSFGYDGGAIYFHTAPAGKKIEYVEANPQACFEFERRVELRTHPQSACQWTFRFESVIGYGVIRELLGPAEKRKGLDEIMRQYSGKTWPFESASLAKVRVWKLAIASMTGKQSKQPKENRTKT
jgi:uncharacterized protein